MADEFRKIGKFVAQPSFKFPPNNVDLSLENYVVLKDSLDPAKMLDHWCAAGQENPAFAVCGPKGAGKSHLAAIIAQHLACRIIVGHGIDPRGEQDAQLVVDDVHDIANPADLHEFLIRRSGPEFTTIITGSGEPKTWAQGLPDLETRLLAFPRFTLSEPNDELLKEVMKKLFKDRQLKVKPEVMVFAMNRIPKTFEAASAFVVACDQLSVSMKSNINMTVANKVIGALFESAPNE